MRILRLAGRVTQAALWSAGTALMAGAAFALMCSTAANAATTPAPEASTTESPYFDVSGGEPGVDALPLKGTTVEVKILGPIADVTVTQHYRNEGQRPIEARYVFPGSTQAAVHAMTVRLGDRELVAKIKEKQAARADFEQARAQGRTAALLAQQRPNVFQMNVAHILPGDDVRVSLRYTELLVPREGRYEFVFPTVVGPRYASPTATGAPMPAMTHRREGVASPARFDLAVDLVTPLAARDIASPSHAIDVTPLQGDGRRVAVKLRKMQSASDDRDFILNYGLAGDAIESGLLMSKGAGGDENFFLAMVEPPKVVTPAAVVPREYVFVVDISGSMHGFPLDTAKTMLRSLLDTLRPVDSFNVMLFSGSARMLAEASMPATPDRIADTLVMLDQQMGSGGTEIVPALRRIAALPKREGVSRTVVVITDGYVTVEREVFALVRGDMGGTNVFAFGIGSSVNRALIEGIARAGRGEAFVITQPDQAPAQASRFRRMIESPVLTQVKTRFEGLAVYDLEPATSNDVLGHRPVLVFGKWRGEPRGRLIVEGRQADGPMRAELAVAGAVASDAHALRHLWARERIAALADEEALGGGQAHQAAITDLGLRYGLLTNYTSFIAVDERVRNTSGATPVDQPSPLPQGVSEAALGVPLPSTPEPGALASAALMLAALLLWGWRAQR